MQALARQRDALAAFEIAGVTTNLAFLQALLARPEVASGDIDTGLIERELAALTRSQRAVTALDMAAACAAVLLRERARVQGAAVELALEPYRRWMLAAAACRRLSFRRHSEHCDATLWYARDGMSLEYAGARQALRFAPREGESFEVTLGDVTEASTAIWSWAATSI